MTYILVVFDEDSSAVQRIFSYLFQWKTASQVESRKETFILRHVEKRRSRRAVIE
jgi:hypothetical protein